MFWAMLEAEEMKTCKQAGERAEGRAEGGDGA
jgi:hypothetical protein